MRTWMLVLAACAPAPSRVERTMLSNRAEVASTGELTVPDCPEATFREAMCGGLANPEDSCGPYGDEVSTTDFAYLVDPSAAPENHSPLSLAQRLAFRDFVLDPEATRSYQESLIDEGKVFGAADAALTCCYQRCTIVEIEMDGAVP